jgi:hypothetical protein
VEEAAELDLVELVWASASVQVSVPAWGLVPALELVSAPGSALVPESVRALAPALELVSALALARSCCHLRHMRQAVRRSKASN